MKQLSTIKAWHVAAAILMMLATCGCTQNNGHIGRLFGSWVLERVTLDGAPVEMPVATETYWSFQSDVVRVILEREHNYAESNYGTFTILPGNILRVDFSHADNDHPAGTPPYGAPTWMGFPPEGVFDLVMGAADSSDRLSLTYVHPSEGVYAYSFTRTW